MSKLKPIGCSLLSLCESALTLIQELGDADRMLPYLIPYRQSGGWPQFEADLEAAIKKEEAQDKTLKITVKGGVVIDVDNVPEGWSVEIDDQD